MASRKRTKTEIKQKEIIKTLQTNYDNALQEINELVKIRDKQGERIRELEYDIKKIHAETSIALKDYDILRHLLRNNSKY